MEYETTTGRWSKKLIGIVSFMAAFAAAKLLVPPALEFFSRKTTNWAERYETEIANQPDFKNLFVAMKAKFPNDYERLKSEIVAKLETGESGAVLRAHSFAFMRTFMSNHKSDIAKAPSTSLTMLRDAQLAVGEAIRSENVDMCGRFVMTGLSQSDRPSAQANRVLGNLGVAQLDAASEGIAHPISRKTTVMSDADGIALLNQMQRNGLTDEQLKIFASEDGLSKALPAVQCEIGLRMLRAVAMLPKEQADRLSAYMIVNS